MKSLYLIRHAKSSWKDLSLDDFDRPLNKRGKGAAPFMGKKMNERKEVIDQFISSPAKRAICTARIIAEEFNIKGSIIEQGDVYHASTTALLSIINHLDNAWGSVALVGHNPGFTDLADYLSGAGIYNMPTCGMLRIDFEIDDWALVSQDSGSLIWFDYPKRYPELQG